MLIGLSPVQETKRRRGWARRRRNSCLRCKTWGRSCTISRRRIKTVGSILSRYSRVEDEDEHALLSRILFFQNSTEDYNSVRLHYSPGRGRSGNRTHKEWRLLDLVLPLSWCFGLEAVWTPRRWASSLVRLCVTFSRRHLADPRLTGHVDTPKRTRTEPQ